MNSSVGGLEGIAAAVRPCLIVTTMTHGEMSPSWTVPGGKAIPERSVAPKNLAKGQHAGLFGRIRLPRV